MSSPPLSSSLPFLFLPISLPIPPSFLSFSTLITPPALFYLPGPSLKTSNLSAPLHLRLQLSKRLSPPTSNPTLVFATVSNDEGDTRTQLRYQKQTLKERIPTTSMGWETRPWTE